MTSATPQVILYDTTLRDGTQQEGISLTLKDKLDITTKLDELGIHIIEGGWPFSNPKDEEYFRRVRSLPLKTAKIAAFGSTRRAGVTAEQDGNLQALIASKATIITLVGKTWDLHVTDVLETTLEENVLMISDSISYLKGLGREAHFDAEHFFDGYAANPDYAMQCLKAAQDAGADVIHLCDTNGGVLPQRLGEVVDALRQSLLQFRWASTSTTTATWPSRTPSPPFSTASCKCKGTINGYGERCGNANLCSIIPGLQTKMGIRVVSDEQLNKLTTVAHEIGELVNMGLNPSQPYVGTRAFTHKGGLHAAAVAKVERSYEHMDPSTVGNARRVLVSELSGRSNVLAATKAMGIDVPADTARTILEQVKNAEAAGFQYEGAEASFEMLVRRAMPDYTPVFVLEDFMALVETLRRRPSRPGANGDSEDLLSEAIVKVRVGEEQYHTAAEGNGPVNALDEALRKALTTKFPEIGVVRLTDYKVRILNQESATAATVRVLIESTDGDHVWRTVGSHTNIIHASWMALADSLEYWLLHWSATAKGKEGA